MKRRASAVLAALLAAGALAACGGDDDEGADTTPDTNAPVNTDTPGQGTPAPEESERGEEQPGDAD